MFLRHLHTLLQLVAFLQQSFKKLFGLEFDDGCDFKEGHAGLCGPIIGRESDNVLKGDAIGVEVEVGFVAEAGYVHDCAEVQMRAELKVIVHSN